MPKRMVTAVLALFAFAACAGPTSNDPGTATDLAAANGSVTLVTHDSFAIPDELIDEFEAANNLTVQLVAPGDGGTLVNQLILTKDAPLGDAVFGIDNAFAARAINADVFAPYFPADASSSVAALSVDVAGYLTAVDYSDVCINIDHAWFEQAGLAEPSTLADLAAPEYADLLVVTNPATSSPGLAFLLATIGAYPDQWQDYWADLVANGVKVAPSWTDAYTVDFSGSSGRGPRPLVVSYASSPPFEVVDGVATTSALLETCFRQVEYAGVLNGAANPDGARQLVDFLVSAEVQAQIPNTMYMYPADDTVSLPQDWVDFAPLAPEPFQVLPADIEANRDEWISQWTAIVVG